MASKWDIFLLQFLETKNSISKTLISWSYSAKISFYLIKDPLPFTY
jgi:hypothetical protein